MLEALVCLRSTATDEPPRIIRAGRDHRHLFTHDRAREEMTVTIVRKPKLLPEAVLWAGVALRRRAARQESHHAGGSIRFARA
jgi:hypothetical protein